MTLDSLIEIFTMPDNVKTELTQPTIFQIGALFQELRERRETELSPCNKYLKSSLAAQYDHVRSEQYEVGEVLVMWMDEKIKRLNGQENALSKAEDWLAEELVDLQTSCQTMLTILGADIPAVRRQVITKNQKRGYYEKVI